VVWVKTNLVKGRFFWMLKMPQKFRMELEEDSQTYGDNKEFLEIHEDDGRSFFFFKISSNKLKETNWSNV
jgi:hypothetical protein